MRVSIRLSLLLATVATMLTLLIATPAFAYDYPADCYNCKKVQMLTSDCVTPASGSWGTGIYCSIEEVFLNVICTTSGGSCLYVCYGCDTGGGGGGTGGGGGGTCDTRGGSCPPQCFDCGGMYY